MRAPVHDLHLSNLFTYLALACAMGALAVAGSGAGLAASGALIALAALLDTFDGWFARRFARSPRQARVGAALDSLVDAVVCGLTPVIVMTARLDATSTASAMVWWGAAFAYVLCGVTRLSFFNVEDAADRFVGLPTPAMALVWSTALLSEPVAASLGPPLLVAGGAAMIWPFAFPRPRGLGLLAFALWAVALVAVHGARVLTSS